VFQPFTTKKSEGESIKIKGLTNEIFYLIMNNFITEINKIEKKKNEKNILIMDNLRIHKNKR